MNEGGNNWELRCPVTFPSHPGQWHRASRAAGLFGHVLDHWEIYRHWGSSSILVAFLIFSKGISFAISGRSGKCAGEISTVFFR